MASYNTNDFRSGLKIMLDGEPAVITECEFVKPGKGQAFARVRLRKLISNKLLEKPSNLLILLRVQMSWIST